MDGVILIDKPKGMTSNKVLNILKKKLNIKKAGHTGSLDPLATGILPICIGRATKFSQSLLDSNKSYLVTAKLGVITDSYDIDGKIVQENNITENPELIKTKIIEILSGFQGQYQQIPPLFSALKHEGKPLYYYARKDFTKYQGLALQKARIVEIYKIDFVDYNHASKTVKFEVSCSKGTYIRSIVHDLGQRISYGAIVIDLRRIRVGSIGLDKLFCLDNIAELDPVDYLMDPAGLIC